MIPEADFKNRSCKFELLAEGKHGLSLVASRQIVTGYEMVGLIIISQNGSSRSRVYAFASKRLSSISLRRILLLIENH